jgi:hypothetical protein
VIRLLDAELGIGVVLAAAEVLPDAEMLEEGEEAGAEMAEEEATGIAEADGVGNEEAMDDEAWATEAVAETFSTVPVPPVTVTGPL